MTQEISPYDAWFTSSYDRIRNHLQHCYLGLDEDTFHDAYLFVRKRILLGKKLTEFEPYFIGCYKKACISVVRYEQRYYHPEEDYFQQLQLCDEEGTSVEKMVSQDKLVQDILIFIKKKYPPQDFTLFNLRNYEARCTYQDLSDYSGISLSRVFEKVNSITNAIRGNSNFFLRNAMLGTC